MKKEHAYSDFNEKRICAHCGCEFIPDTPKDMFCYEHIFKVRVFETENFTVDTGQYRYIVNHKNAPFFSHYNGTRRRFVDLVNDFEMTCEIDEVESFLNQKNVAELFEVYQFLISTGL